MPASASKSELRDVIRAAGMRATASRIAVLAQLRNATRPISHAEIVDALEGEPWDRATLYRNLVDLTNAGLARKVELGDRVWRFEDSGPVERHDAALHPHFVCTVCGSVSCLPDAAVTGPDNGSQNALLKRPVEVQVRGVCNTCDS
jgi:Fur family ferric uptake transcriptional regulator